MPASLPERLRIADLSGRRVALWAGAMKAALPVRRCARACRSKP